MCSPPWPPTGWCASESRAGRPRTTLSARRSPPESAAVSAAVYTGCSPPPWKQRTPTSRRSHDTTGSRATPLPRRARSSERHVARWRSTPPARPRPSPTPVSRSSPVLPRVPGCSTPAPKRGPRMATWPAPWPTCTALSPTPAPAPPDHARIRSEEALALHRRLGDAQGVARILDGRAMATFLDGHISRAVEMFGRAAQLFEDAGELLRVVTPRSTLGHGLVFLAQPADGLTETTAALLLARDIDAPEGQAYALWHRSEALSGLGRGEEAEDDAREALRIAVSIDHRGWTATAYRALGIAMQTLDRLDDAAAAFQSSAAAAGDTLTLFASWAAARSALVALRCGSPAHAARHVERALALGPPLGHYEARLAEVELAAARGADDVSVLAAGALTAAQTGGHLVSVPQLAKLANDASGRDRRPSMLRGIEDD